MPKVIRYEHYFTDVDVLDIELVYEGNALVDFALNYRYDVDEHTSVEVARYDTSHGVPHLHRFWRPEGKRVQELVAAGEGQPMLSRLLDRARDDLLRNWAAYRRLREASLR